MDTAHHPSPPRRGPESVPRVLRLGYVPLVHAAPLLVARHLGLYARHGLRVRLSREVGWATIREKILGGELEAAQALAPMPLAMTLGVGSPRCQALTALVLNLHGNTIVLSRRLWRESAGIPSRLRALRHQDGEPLTFGIVYPQSSHSFLLSRWLGEAGLMPDHDYRVVVVPPQQMAAHLRAGHIDGGCVGEPWGSLAVQSGIGVIAALSADLAPGHPEKVLLVRHSFAEMCPGHHAALVAALTEACAWCANPDHHEDLVRLLASREGLDTHPVALRPGITGAFDLGENRRVTRPDALMFHGRGVNEPSEAHATWVATQFHPRPSRETLAAVYRRDLHRDALAPPSAEAPSPSPVSTTTAPSASLHEPLSCTL